MRFVVDFFTTTTCPFPRRCGSVVHPPFPPSSSRHSFLEHTHVLARIAVLYFLHDELRNKHYGQRHRRTNEGESCSLSPCLCPLLILVSPPSSNHSSSVDSLARQQTPSLNPHTVMLVLALETFPSLLLSLSPPSLRISPPSHKPSPASLVHQPTFPPLRSATRTTADARRFQLVTSPPT